MDAKSTVGDQPEREKDYNFHGKTSESERARILYRTRRIIYYFTMCCCCCCRSASAFAFFAHKIKYPSLALLSRAPFFISSRAAHLLEMFMPCERKMRKLRQRHFSLCSHTSLTPREMLSLESTYTTAKTRTKILCLRISIHQFPITTLYKICIEVQR